MSDVHLHSHRCEHKTKLLVMNHCQSRMNMWLTDPRGLTKKVNATSSDSSAHCLIGKFGPIKPHISSRIDTTTMLQMKSMAGDEVVWCVFSMKTCCELGICACSGTMT